jgi:hypothetical protein
LVVGRTELQVCGASLLSVCGLRDYRLAGLRAREEVMMTTTTKGLAATLMTDWSDGLAVPGEREG